MKELRHFDFLISRRIIRHCSRFYRQTYFPWQGRSLRLSWRSWPSCGLRGAEWCEGFKRNVMSGPFLSREALGSDDDHANIAGEMISLSQLFRCTLTEITSVQSKSNDLYKKRFKIDMCWTGFNHMKWSSRNNSLFDWRSHCIVIVVLLWGNQWPR